MPIPHTYNTIHCCACGFLKGVTEWKNDRVRFHTKLLIKRTSLRSAYNTMVNELSLATHAERTAKSVFSSLDHISVKQL